MAGRIGPVEEETQSETPGPTPRTDMYSGETEFVTEVARRSMVDDGDNEDVSEDSSTANIQGRIAPEDYTTGDMNNSTEGKVIIMNKSHRCYIHKLNFSYIRTTNI